MPSTPFDTAHQNNLRMLIGKVLPDAGAQPIAEAVAGGPRRARARRPRARGGGAWGAGSAATARLCRLLAVRSWPIDRPVRLESVGPSAGSAFVTR